MTPTDPENDQKQRHERVFASAALGHDHLAMDPEAPGAGAEVTRG